jgi:acyl CoA:acetate/3-ketoacid CoA transferase alpha subunit
MSEPFVSDRWVSVAKVTRELIGMAMTSIKENDPDTALASLEKADAELREALDRSESSG